MNISTSWNKSVVAGLITVIMTLITTFGPKWGINLTVEQASAITGVLALLGNLFVPNAAPPAPPAPPAA